jgi:rhodanese-related sulfurtransferase
MKIIHVHELKNLYHTNQVTLIDVRELQEHQAESIQASYCIPLSVLCVQTLPMHSKPFVLYCRSGIRSLSACKKLLDQDPTLELYSLAGGIIAWKQAKFPTQTIQ